MPLLPFSPPPRIHSFATMWGGTPQSTLTTAGLTYEFGTGTGSTAWTTNQSIGITTSGTTMTVQNVGFYRVGMSVSAMASTTSQYLAIQILKNGSLMISNSSYFEQYFNSTTQTRCIAGSIVVSAVPNDAFTLTVYSNTTAATPTWVYTTFFICSA